jgi:hypothetical protein
MIREIAVLERIAVIRRIAVVGEIAVVGRFAVVKILYKNTDNFDRSQLFKFIIFIFRIA